MRVCADLVFKYRLAYLPGELNASVDLGQTVNVNDLCDFILKCMRVSSNEEKRASIEKD